jgi:hypothetical protein
VCLGGTTSAPVQGLHSHTVVSAFGQSPTLIMHFG